MKRILIVLVVLAVIAAGGWYAYGNYTAQQHAAYILDEVVVPTEKTLDPDDRDAYLTALLGMRKAAFEAGLWCPHMPEEWGGMGLGQPVQQGDRARARRKGLLVVHDGSLDVASLRGKLL